MMPDDKTCRRADGTFGAGNAATAKYDDKYADMLLDFFSAPISRTEYAEIYGRDGSIRERRPVEVTALFPTMGLFARSINVGTSTLAAWAGITFGGKYKHDRFAIAYRCAKEWAEGMIVSGALSGKLDSNMARFVLSANYGMTDRRVVDARVSGLTDKDADLLRRVGKRVGVADDVDPEE